MTFTLPDLPYAKDALSPAMSADTLEYHHGKHHKSYIDKLNAAIDGTPLADKALEEIVVATAGKPDQTSVFNNAAQTWNHNMLWQSMSPDGGGKPDGELARQIEAAFGSFKDFRDEFIKAGTGQFGSGWIWLVVENGKLAIRATGNADTPLADGHEVLMTCDVWEHAYYLDYQNRRQAYLEVLLGILADMILDDAKDSCCIAHFVCAREIFQRRL